jgi:hypothetical protein
MFVGRKTEKAEAEQQPVRLLDDLFRKTKATPCLYWLPLSAEQVRYFKEFYTKKSFNK